MKQKKNSNLKRAAGPQKRPAAPAQADQTPRSRDEIRREQQLRSLKKRRRKKAILYLCLLYTSFGARWQTNQSLYAIGSGGFLGAGLGNSKQKHLYVSEPQNDFIFSIVCEELGFIGATAIIILFGLLVWRGFVIAMKARDRFGALLAMGLVFQVGLQVALNIAVVTDTVPNTGISLPFFSYGGTSLMILLMEMGIVLSVSRYSRVRKM